MPRCGICGLGLLPNGKTCSAISDCQSDWCVGTATAGCQGTCERKAADGETCPYNLFTGGDDKACESGKCLVLLAIDPTKRVEYCQPRGGSTQGMRCTEDKDCALSSGPSGLWCKGGGATSLGECAECPSYCSPEQGCNACNNDENRMQCGRSSGGEKVVCAASVIGEKFTNLFDCLFDDLIGCGINLAKEVASCIAFLGGDGGENCDIRFGEPCLDSKEDFPLGNRRKLSPPQVTNSSGVINGAAPPDEGAMITSFVVPFSDPNQDEHNRQLAENDVTAQGEATVASELRFVVNPVTLIAKVEFEATITTEAQLSLNVVAGKKYSPKPKKLGPIKRIFRKVIFVKALIIILEFEVQPHLYFEAEIDVAATSTVKISSAAKVNLQIEIDANDKSFTPTFTQTLEERNLELESAASVSFRSIARIGPQFIFKVNKVPAKVDVMLALHLNAEAAVLASQPSSGPCATGTVSGSLGVDVRFQVDFNIPDPRQVAYEICLEAMGIAEQLANAKVKGKAANCLLEGFGQDKVSPPDVCGQLRADSDAFLPQSSRCESTSSSVGAELLSLLSGDWKHYPLYQLKTKLNYCLGEAVTTESSSDMSLSACRDDQGHFKRGQGGKTWTSQPPSPSSPGAAVEADDGGMNIALLGGIVGGAAGTAACWKRPI